MEGNSSLDIVDIDSKSRITTQHSRAQLDTSIKVIAPHVRRALFSRPAPLTMATTSVKGEFQSAPMFSSAGPCLVPVLPSLCPRPRSGPR